MRNILLLLIPTLIFTSCNHNEIVINAGIGGNTTTDLLNRINKDVIDKSPDIVLIMVGTNDMLNSKKMKSYSEYRLNLEKIVKTLLREDVQIVLCSPPTVDSIYLFERHDKNLFTEEPNQKLDSISDIMKSISTTENVSFIDINKEFHNLNLPIHNTDNYIRNVKNSSKRDGVHPTSEGYKLIAKTIFNYLKEGRLIKPKMKIICLGDSITFGTGMKGEGTNKGDTYPAVLKSLITKTFGNNLDR